jgi:hypothetical protein
MCDCNKDTCASGFCEKSNETSLIRSLTDLLNTFSIDNSTNTPDFILANYLLDCLSAYDTATRWNASWHSISGVPDAERENGPKLRKF